MTGSNCPACAARCRTVASRRRFTPVNCRTIRPTLLGPARNGAETWLGDDYGFMRFAPAHLTLRPGDGPPHIRLDRAAQFLIGDRL